MTRVPSYPSPGGPATIPRGIWALGVVSLFMDISSEMIHGLLPVFLVTALGASVLSLGLIEGVAEAAAAVTRFLSGLLSDRLGRRKLLAVAGYGLSALAKPLFPLASDVVWVFGARLLDRFGKGIRVAPRDALVADLAPTEVRGASYGLRQSLDTVGALAGPLLAIVLMALFAGDMRAVFWVAMLPAIGAVIVLVVAVHETAGGGAPASTPTAVRIGASRGLGRSYWLVLFVGASLTLARFSEAFLVLRAMDLGLAVALAPAVLVVMNAAYAASAYPAGRLSDRIGRWGLLGAGVGVLVIADIVLALSASLASAAAGVALWGLHMGLTQGLLTALVADAVPSAARGTAFGLFHLASGVAILLASVLAGWLWDAFGAPAPFLAGAAIASLSLLAIAARR